MSQQGRLVDNPDNFETITGNTGGPVPFDGDGNIDLLGMAPYTVSGNPGLYTLTITDDGTVAYTYTADSGTATPAANNLNILGDATQGSVTSGATDTITITNSDASTSQKGVLETSTDAESIAGTSSVVAVVPSSLAAKLGDQTANSISYGTGTTTAIGWTSALTDGQIAIGATGGIPAAANITSSGGSITITNGTNSINLETDDSHATSFPTDAGTAVPVAGALTEAGGNLINTSGAGSTVTINADDSVAASVGTDSGTVTPASNAFSIVGTGSVTTSGSGTTVTIDGGAFNKYNVTLLDSGDSPYTVVSTDHYLSCDVSAGTLTIDLPDAPDTGTFYIVKDSGGDAGTNNITVTTTGGAVTIDGSTTFVMNTAYEASNFIFNGTSYEVF